MNNPAYLNLLFVQTWQVAIVAIGVGAVTRYLARSQPQLSHLLWGLVLLKVLTPPLWSSPTSVFAWLARGENAVIQSLQTAPQANLGDDRGRVSSLTLSQQPAIRLELQSAASGAATRRTAEAASLTETELEVSSTREIDSLSRRLSKFLVPFWLTGVGVIAMLGLLRIGSFWRRATRRTSYNMPDKQSELARLEQRVQSLANQTAKKLNMRRNIRLRLIDAPIGPAVVGLIRPTILMPAGIAVNRSPEFLEPILAHELIHIRRGDLYWSALQSLATNLLWFHPAVWYASRKLSIESERSCDEQTIAWLQCSPQAYARGLIDVLERKHQLRSAPALPGVRPMDVTRNRLERIMSLGQGSRKRTPAWIWVVFIVGLATVLPGAAQIVAQEEDQRPDGAPTTKQVSQTPAPLPMVPPAEGPWASRFENAAIEVGDLLQRLSASGGYNLEAARSVLETLLPSRTLDQINQEGFAKYGAYISNLPPLRIEGTTLRVFETREQIAKLRKAVELFRMHGFGQVSLEIRFLRVPKQQLDELGIAWQKAKPLSEAEFSSSQFHDLGLSASSSRPSAAIERPTPPRIDVFTFENGMSVAQPSIELSPSQNFKAVPKFEQPTDFDPAEASVPVELAAPSSRTPAFYAHASANRLSQLLDQAQNEPKTNVLQAPRVTAFNGQIIEIMDSVQRPFVTGVVSARDTDESNGQPIFQIVRDGVQVITQPIEKPDGKLDLLLALNEQTVQEVETFTYNQTTSQDDDGTTIQTGTTIQIPQILSRYFAIQSELERGESLLATSGISTLHDSQQILIAVVSWQAAEQSDDVNRRIADSSAPVARAAYEPTAGENPNIASAFLPPATVSNSATKYSGPEQLVMQRSSQYTLDAGDVIGASIEGILAPSKQNKPGSASNGFPITVLEDGTISLPLIEAITVQGRTLPEVRQAIQSAYVDAKIVSSAPKVITTLLRKRQYNVLVRRWDQSGSSDPQLIRLPAFENDVLNALMASGGLPHPDVFESVAILRAHVADQEDLEKLDSDELGSHAEPILIRVGAEIHIAPGANMELGEGDQLLVLSRR